MTTTPFFPARDTFDADRRVKAVHMRVYAHCRRTLDFRQVRACKGESVALGADVDRGDVSRALTALVTWGYLAEHPRDAYGTRQFTLCYSVGVGNSPTTGTADAA